MERPSTEVSLNFLLCLYNEERELEEAKSQDPLEIGLDQTNNKLISDRPEWEQGKKLNSQPTNVHQEVQSSSLGLTSAPLPSAGQ